MRGACCENCALKADPGTHGELSKLIDASSVQSLLADFYGLTGIPVSLIDLHGNVIVGVGWQDICTNFHRVQPGTLRNCVESDTELSVDVPAGTWKLYKCKNGMWDVVTPLVLSGKTIGNIFSGQFLFADEQVDYEEFRRRARRFGFPEREYLAALDRVPRISRSALDRGMAFFTKFGALLSQLSYSNFELKRSLAEQDELARVQTDTAELLARAQAIAHLGSWELDLARNRLSWSDEVYRIFGLRPHEFAASYDAFLERVHPEDRAAVDAAYARSLLENRDSYEITHRVIQKDTGEVRWVHEKCEHVRDESGAVIRSIGMVHDITHRKRAEQDVERQNTLLLRANRELEEFAYVASHDLQEPLRTINAYAELLVRRTGLCDDPAATEFAAYIGAGVQRMDELIQDLLQYSRVIHTQAPPESRADLNSSLERAMDALGAQIRQTSARIRSDRLPHVNGDERQLAQVFQNLISNGLKYSDRSRKPEVSISAKPEGGGWVIRVADNGIGINPEYSETIFGLFKRLHTQAYPGTGLGLAISRRIIERFGGRIWAESAGEGCGSTFSFWLPAGV